MITRLMDRCIPDVALRWGQLTQGDPFDLGGVGVPSATSWRQDYGDLDATMPPAEAGDHVH